MDSDWRLALYTRLRRPGWSPAPGEHWLVGPISPEALLAVLARTGARPSQRVVVPEGYNRFQVAERLESQGVCPAQSFLAATTERRLLMPLGVHADSAEGYLFPATYELFVNSPPENVLATLVNETFRRFPAVTDELRATGPTRKLGWGMHEILTLASMVEKESGQESERPLIASVFFNRLQSDTFRPLRMLQSDPTAGYGCLLKSQLDSCSNYDGQVSARMLRDSGNRYNTYRHAGLPPGPIANPGAAAVRAVLKPSKSDYLFFVASSGRGHRFSRTLEQHREATRRR